MQYRVQFLDGSANVVSEMHSYAWNVASVIELLAAIDWPPAAVRLRILDRESREVNFR